MEIRTTKPFVQCFENVRDRTMRVARCITPEQIEWTYASGKFTLGDLLRHIAVAERYMWAENVQGHESRYEQHGKELADGLENVLAFMERLHSESLEIFFKLSDQDLQRKCTTPGGAGDEQNPLPSSGNRIYITEEFRRDNTMVKLAIALFLGTFNQVVFVGQQPTKAELEKFCNSEKVQPNLELQQQTHVSGRITDIVGVPLKKSRLELREYISEHKQVTVKVSTTDDNGKFDLGDVGKGEYRLLASPNRVWKQPSMLECKDKECQLKIALQINPTDQPESACPVK